MQKQFFERIAKLNLPVIKNIANIKINVSAAVVVVVVAVFDYVSTVFIDNLLF